MFFSFDTLIQIVFVFVVFSEEGMETLELTENTVNPGLAKVSTFDFELLKVLGKGGYGKVFLPFPRIKAEFYQISKARPSTNVCFHMI